MNQSRHLRLLRGPQLAVAGRTGNGRVHPLEPDGVVTLRANLERFWTKTLAAYNTAVEQPTKEGA